MNTPYRLSLYFSLAIDIGDLRTKELSALCAMVGFTLNPSPKPQTLDPRP